MIICLVVKVDIEVPNHQEEILMMHLESKDTKNIKKTKKLICFYSFSLTLVDSLDSLAVK